MPQGHQGLVDGRERTARALDGVRPHVLFGHVLRQCQSGPDAGMRDAEAAMREFGIGEALGVQVLGVARRRERGQHDIDRARAQRCEAAGHRIGRAHVQQHARRRGHDRGVAGGQVEFGEHSVADQAQRCFTAGRVEDRRPRTGVLPQGRHVAERRQHGLAQGRRQVTGPLAHDECVTEHSP